MDRLQLFAQVVLALVLVDLLADAVLDALFEVGDLRLRRSDGSTTSSRRLSGLRFSSRLWRRGASLINCVVSRSARWLGSEVWRIMLQHIRIDLGLGLAVLVGQVAHDLN